MMVDRTYLMDSDVFITAKNLYYSFDICPGFWDSVIHHLAAPTDLKCNLWFTQ